MVPVHKTQVARNVFRMANFTIRRLGCRVYRDDYRAA
jgi:hypothetical protein